MAEARLEEEEESSLIVQFLLEEFLVGSYQTPMKKATLTSHPSKTHLLLPGLGGPARSLPSAPAGRRYDGPHLRWPR